MEDTAATRDRFTAGGELGPVDEVAIGRGDAHRGGQSVAIVRWTWGLALAYKPRPLAVDVAFDRLLGWLNERLSLPLRKLTYLDRGEYGWMEFRRGGAVRRRRRDRSVLSPAGRTAGIAPAAAVLDRGRVVCVGRHGELVESNPLYRELISHQLLAG